MITTQCPKVRYMYVREISNWGIAVHVLTKDHSELGYRIKVSLWYYSLKDRTLKIKVTVQFERCFPSMEHISVISWRNPINLYITEKLIKFSKSPFYFYLLISKNRENGHLVSDLCFPFPEFQVGRVAFDCTNYYMFILDTVYSPKPCQRFLKDRFVCNLQPKSRNSTFVMESGGVLSRKLEIFLEH